MPSFSPNLFSGGLNDLAGSVSDLFAGEYTAPAQAAAARAQADTANATAEADILQGQGAAIEGQSYGTAASLAALNAKYTTASTAVQSAQADRALFMTLGTGKAIAAAAGGTEGGSAGDILRANAAQGALSKAVLQEQGAITTAGYQQQQSAYELMQQASGVAQQADIAAAGGEREAAGEFNEEASLFNKSSTGDFIAGGIKAIAGVASIAAAFA